MLLIEEVIMKERKISQEQISEMLLLRKEGFTQKEIARRMQLSQPTISKFIKGTPANVERYWRPYVLPVEELGYIAGFIDGEGCLSFHKEKGGSHSPFVSICNTNQEVIQWFKNKFDWGYKGYTDNRREKPKWNLEMRGMKRIVPLLLAIQPYLIVKKKQANLLLEFSKSKLGRIRKQKGELARELEIVQEIHRLNKKGRF